MEIRQTLENKAHEIQNKAHEIQERVRPEVDAAREKLSSANDEVVKFVTAHPIPCLLGAVAIGYLVGRVARRGSWFGHGKS